MNEKWSLPSGNQVNKSTRKKIDTNYKEEVAIPTPLRAGGRNEKEEFVQNPIYKLSPEG